MVCTEQLRRAHVIVDIMEVMEVVIALYVLLLVPHAHHRQIVRYVKMLI